MIFDLIAGMNAGGGAATWTPAELFKSGEVGFWLDGSDYSTMSQSRTAQVDVTAAGQAVGQWRNKIAGQTSFNFVAANDSARPLTKTTSGKQTVTYDGVDDKLTKASTGNITASGLSIFVGQKTGAVGAPLLMYDGGSDPGATINLQNNVNGTVTGNALNQIATSTELYSVTAPNTIGLIAGISTTPITVRINGVPRTGTTPTSGTVGSAISVVGSATLYSEISQVVFINRVLTSTEITQLEAFIGSKQ